MADRSDELIDRGDDPRWRVAGAGELERLERMKRGETLTTIFNCDEKIARWRDDKPPAECRLEQLDQ